MLGEVRGCAGRWCCSRHTGTAQIPPSSYTLPWGWSRCPGGFSKPPRATAAGPALQARLQQQVPQSPAHTFPSERHPLLPRRTPCSHPARPAPKSPAWSQPWAHVHEAGDGAMGWGRCHGLGTVPRVGDGATGWGWGPAPDQCLPGSSACTGVCWRRQDRQGSKWGLVALPTPC